MNPTRPTHPPCPDNPNDPDKHNAPDGLTSSGDAIGPKGTVSPPGTSGLNGPYGTGARSDAHPHGARRPRRQHHVLIVSALLFLGLEVSAVHLLLPVRTTVRWTVSAGLLLATGCWMWAAVGAWSRTAAEDDRRRKEILEGRERGAARCDGGRGGRSRGYGRPSGMP
ncbi:hypothetical protein ACH4E8_24930 [Streptomyces sp. NPDC017979]|uniref:hypothetical protein n=1 Tax=Streptomyces sp. NPDC017979 TaxID=3365024 RepID=UPI0037AED60E